MRKRKHTKESLESIIQDSISISEVLKKLGLKNTGGNYRLIQLRIREYSISTNHFKKKGWAKGLTSETSEKIKRGNRISNEEMFREGSGMVSGTKLRRRLLELGWSNKCSICELTEWLGKPITLHVDHINGINGDNRLENLRIICPNCHQQTETWGKRNGLVAKLLDAIDLESVGCNDRVGWNPTEATKKCKDCDTNISKTSSRCRKCSDLFKSTLSKRPPKNEFEVICKNSKSNTSIGKHFNVSDNTIKKWKAYYQIK